MYIELTSDSINPWQSDETSPQWETSPNIESPSNDSDQYWCSIKYHEKSKSFGEIDIQTNTPIVRVHCKNNINQTNPDLTYFVNIKSISEGNYTPDLIQSDTVLIQGQKAPDPESTEMLDSFGEGISLTYVNNQLFLTNHSNLGVFYQSWIGNDVLNVHKSTVIEVKPKLEGIIIFDLNYFAEYLNRAAERMQSAIHQRSTDLIKSGIDDLNKLKPGHIIRLSIGAGYGECYIHQSIKFCPCWIEVDVSHQFESYGMIHCLF
jgi:hypothetical protein